MLYVDHLARLSGGEIALVRLLQAVREDVEAHVVLGEDGPLREYLEDAGATVRVLPMPPRLRDRRRGEPPQRPLDVRRAADVARYVGRLRAEIRRVQPDVVHTNSLRAALYGGAAGRLAAVPVVWHVRDRIVTDYLPRSTVVLVRVLARLLPSGVVANSRATRATLPRPRRASRAHPVVSDIAPAAVLRPRSAADDDGTHPLRVGIVGRIAAWKGHRVFLDAFATAFAPGEAQAWIVGSPLFGEESLEDALRTHAQQLGIAADVVWRGFRDDVPAELARLDVLVHASTVPEPFAPVVVEGMAAGVPVVAAAAGGPLEIVRHGEDGLLVPPGDATELAAALRFLADDPRKRQWLGAAGRKASRRFSPENARRRVLDVYCEVLGAAPVRPTTTRGAAPRPTSRVPR